jgi:hypothetical protein
MEAFHLETLKALLLAPETCFGGKEEGTVVLPKDE